MYLLSLSLAYCNLAPLIQHSLLSPPPQYPPSFLTLPLFFFFCLFVCFLRQGFPDFPGTSSPFYDLQYTAALSTQSVFSYSGTCVPLASRSNSPSPGASADKVQSKESCCWFWDCFYRAGGEEARALSRNDIPIPNS